MDIDPIPAFPAADDVPPGSLLLVRLQTGSPPRHAVRTTIAHVWSQNGRTFWLVDLEPLRFEEVTDALLITPNAPFGDVSQLVWADLLPEEKERLYWGALQALAARPSFERAVADAWVREAFKRDRAEGEDGKGHASLAHRLRRTALEEAKARILAKLDSEVDLAAVTKGIDATTLMRQHLRDNGWQGAGRRITAVIQAHVDEQLEAAVVAEVEERLGETFAYLRKGVGLALNGALAKLGTTAKRGDNV